MPRPAFEFRIRYNGINVKYYADLIDEQHTALTASTDCWSRISLAFRRQAITTETG